MTALRTLLVCTLLVRGLAGAVPEPLTTAGNCEPIPHPLQARLLSVREGDKLLAVPETMVYVPAGEYRCGDRLQTTVHLDGYAIGKFHVTNAEYREFCRATAERPPRYWPDGEYPDGKGNHPVAYVSLLSARRYAAWLSRETGREYSIPTAQQWEQAARGPEGYLYPWGNRDDVSYRGGHLHTRFNFNAVAAVEALQMPDREVEYVHRDSPYRGQRLTLGQLVAYGADGRRTPFAVSESGHVQGWVSQDTHTGFIYTDLFDEWNRGGGWTSPVGQYPDGASYYGCFDMAGNLWDWTETAIIATNGAERGRTVNEIRGGSWYATSRSCRSVSIGEGREASGAYNTVGFRVVMRPAAMRSP